MRFLLTYPTASNLSAITVGRVMFIDYDRMDDNVDGEGNLVGHRRRRHKQRSFLAKVRGHPLLEGQCRRVFALLFVANVGSAHGQKHGGGGAGGGVADEVDECHGPDGATDGGWWASPNAQR
jgi:hypothetical protein